MIDHVGSAGDATHLTDEWREGMRAAGNRKNVFLKVSALTEQMDELSKSYGNAPRDTACYKPVLDHSGSASAKTASSMAATGRCDKGGMYADEFKIASEYFTAKGSGASEKYFWKNSLAAYRWIER